MDLAALCRRLEALDYALPAAGLPAEASPLLEQARGRPLCVLHARRGATLRGALTAAPVHASRFSCCTTWRAVRRATEPSSSAAPSRAQSWTAGATRRVQTGSHALHAHVSTDNGEALSFHASFAPFSLLTPMRRYLAQVDALREENARAMRENTALHHSVRRAADG